MKHDTTAQLNQQGFVSIVVCLIIMVILSLVTIGFAQIMSREQRSAIDRQLSTQAFYAAESGVNDARDVKLAGYDTTCGSSAKALDTAQSVNETCVFVNDKPKSIKYDNVSIGPKVFPVHAVDSTGARITPDKVVINWSKAATTNAGWPDFRAASSSLLPNNEWGINTGLVRLYIIPFNAGWSRDQIDQNTSYMLLNPVSGGTGTQLLSNGQNLNFGSIVNGNCSGTACTMTVTGLAASYTDLYISISSMYYASNFEISASKAGTALSLIDVQAIVDSTGRTTDVLRRIEARVPLIPDNNYPVAALNGDVCKLWEVEQSPSNSAHPLCP
jgi:hypothetical protein